MEAAWLVRLRWRRLGAWLWPTFAALTVVDGVIGHLLPPTGETQSLASAALVGCLLNLIGVILLSRPFGALLRRMRPDLPGAVARNYAGTSVVVSITVALLAAGIVHHPTVVRDRRAMDDAIARAQAWIGDRAPATFRRNVRFADTFVIESGSMYRTCVPSIDRRRSYCVIVNERSPAARSVRFGGSEPNSIFGQGVG